MSAYSVEMKRRAIEKIETPGALITAGKNTNKVSKDWNKDVDLMDWLKELGK